MAIKGGDDTLMAYDASLLQGTLSPAAPLFLPSLLFIFRTVPVRTTSFLQRWMEWVNVNENQAREWVWISSLGDFSSIFFATSLSALALHPCSLYQSFFLTSRDLAHAMLCLLFRAF